jgi:hypothetical protein
MYILLLMRFVKEEKAMDQKAIIRAVCISERKGEQCAAVCSTGTGLAAVCKTSHRSQISLVLLIQIMQLPSPRDSIRLHHFSMRLGHFETRQYFSCNFLTRTLSLSKVDGLCRWEYNK